MPNEFRRYTASHAASDAFRTEYKEEINKGAIRKEIESYLGEYRLQVPIYEYTLSYSTVSNGQKRVIDPDTGKSMVDKVEKAIEKRAAEWKSVNREYAEKIGFIKLEEQLSIAGDNDVIIWASPPGPKKDGYGEYGFLYVGVMEGEKLVMKAIRVEKPTIVQYNTALTELTGIGHSFERAEQFLDRPLVVHHLKADLLTALKDHFHFSPDYERMDKFKKLTVILNPYINEFIALAQSGVRGEPLLKKLHFMENIADDLKTNPVEEISWEWQKTRKLSPDAFANRYSRQPEFVAGSCGGSLKTSEDSFNSNDIINSLSNDLQNLLKDNKSEKKNLKCPACGKIVHIDPCVDGCPECCKSHEEIIKIIKEKAAMNL